MDAEVRVSQGRGNELAARLLPAATSSCSAILSALCKNGLRCVHCIVFCLYENYGEILDSVIRPPVLSLQLHHYSLEESTVIRAQYSHVLP